MNFNFPRQYLKQNLNSTPRVHVLGLFRLQTYTSQFSFSPISIFYEFMANKLSIYSTIPQRLHTLSKRVNFRCCSFLKKKNPNLNLKLPNPCCHANTQIIPSFNISYFLNTHGLEDDKNISKEGKKFHSMSNSDF